MNKYNLNFKQWLNFLFAKVPMVLYYKDSYRENNFKSRCKGIKSDYVTK